MSSSRDFPHFCENVKAKKSIYGMMGVIKHWIFRSYVRGGIKVVSEKDGLFIHRKNFLRLINCYFDEVDVLLQDSEFPKDTGINPMLAQIKGPTGHLARSGGFRLSNTFQAHSHPVSRYRTMHQRKIHYCFQPKHKRIKKSINKIAVIFNIFWDLKYM